MNKLKDDILERVSDRNNAYRDELDKFKESLEQLSTKLAGDTVTLSNYSVDFSSIMDTIKEKLIDNISQIIDSYAIKDLRNVESVNVQFVDKINDRIDGAVINDENDKNTFISNLNNLLNEKYLEIVRIKRTEFFDYEDGNLNVEECINDFITYLNSIYDFSQEKMETLISSYKSDLYNNIRNMFNNINKLYLSVFVDEIIKELSSDDSTYETEQVIVNEPTTLNSENVFTANIPVVPDLPFKMDIPDVPDIDFNVEQNDLKPVDDVQNEGSNVQPMAVPDIEPQVVSTKGKDNKKTYDVDEILKIAKSPVVATTDNTSSDDNYISVTPLNRVEESDVIDSEFDEKEIVNEMISRLKKRLGDINLRQSKYESDEKKVLDDEAFVNELIENARKKKIELDNLEEELNKKENELKERQASLEKKINDIMPFANAVLKEE